MPGIGDKISSYLRSPKGQQMVGKARDYAAKPENRAKLEQLANKIGKRGGKQPPAAG